LGLWSFLKEWPLESPLDEGTRYSLWLFGFLFVAGVVSFACMLVGKVRAGDMPKVERLL
jgi:hypothetical protein